MALSYHKYPESYDIIVVGAGHAGCEAALAPARMGFKVLILTIALSHIAFMPYIILLWAGRVKPI